MKIYLVGGAVRDQLLGLKVKDRDYVVVGATPEQMLALGYKPVGKDFPVFLHPQTHEEYALARTERKTAKGYHGFQFNTDKTVTLEDDLSRRDLTVNAMAQDLQSQQIIDPFNGQHDIKERQLRHVSKAFTEDPVRVLRIARFAARYANLGFVVHPQTNTLMQEMVADGEIDALVPERVWQELSAALNENTPSAFVKVLRACHALKILFPEFDKLFGIPQTKKWHPEIDTGIHCMMAMDKAADLNNDIAFAVFTHDLGKGLTPKHILPSHSGHEQAGVPLVKALCERLKVPAQHKKLALTVCRWHLYSHMAYELEAQTIHKLFQNTGAYQQAQQFDKFLQACQADAMGRLGQEFQKYPQANYLRKCLQATAQIDTKLLIAKGFTGKLLGFEIDQQRIELINRVKLSSPFL
ncbi:MAG TPA: multifunctional CCA addition/repair protein [Oceanospirillales bacterium]|nr:multifunctional CCA addition/repair protein [Oceanospirillales bacterium]